MNNISKIVFVIIGVIGLLTILNFSTPYLYRALPNDFGRTRIILDSLTDDSFNPNIVVFGDSKAMAGVNCNIIKDELNGLNAYSLTGTGQPLLESALYYSYLPTSVTCVIQCVNTSAFKSEPDMSSVAALAFHMYGYKYDYSTKKLLSPYVDDYFSKSSVVANFQARTCLKVGVSSTIRKITDDDAPSDEINSIIYPYVYPSNRTQYTYKRNIDALNAKENPFINADVNMDYIKLISKLHDYLYQRKIMNYVVLMPENPDLSFTAEKQTTDFIKKIYKNFPRDVNLISCFDLLSADDFYDDQHPNRIGAEKISKIIISYLKQTE